MANSIVKMTTGGTYESDLADIEQQKKLAEMLQQQSMLPIERSRYKGLEVPISPLSGLAKILEAYTGASTLKKATEDQKALSAKTQGDAVEWLSHMRDTIPATADTPATDTAPAMLGAPARARNPAEEMAYSAKGMSNPLTRALAMSMMTPKEGTFGAPRDETVGGKTVTAAYDKNGNRKVIDTGGATQAVGADTQARLAQERAISDRAFTGLSENQKQTLANQARQQNISAAELYFRTGQRPGGMGMTPEGAPPAQPMPPQQPPPQGGAPMPPAGPQQPQLSPQAQQELAVNAAKLKQEAAQNLPNQMQQGKSLLSTIDQMIGTKDADGNVLTAPHKGLKDIVGHSSATNLIADQFRGGGDGADFKALYDQVQGGAFLQALNQMKGSGAISEIEGTKATAALNSAQRSQSPEAFMKSMAEFRQAVANGMDNSQTRAGVAPTSDWSVVQ